MQLLRKLDRVAAREGGERAVSLRIGLLEAGRDLGQARVARDERRARPAAAASAATIPNASGKIDGTTATSASGSRWTRCRCSSGPGEERVPRRQRLELVPVVAEADDHRPRVEAVQRLEQQVDALVVEQLAEVEDGRPLAREEALEPARVALVREPLVRGCRGWAGRGGTPRSGRSGLPRGPSAGTRRRRRPAAPRGRARRGRRPPRAPPRMCAEPTKTASARASASRPQAASSALPRIEYSSSEPCALTANRAPGRRRDRPARQDVVREDEVGRQVASSARALAST